MSDHDFSIQNFLNGYEAQDGGGRGFDRALGQIGRTVSSGKNYPSGNSTSVGLGDPRPAATFRKRNNKQVK